MEVPDDYKIDIFKNVIDIDETLVDSYKLEKSRELTYIPYTSDSEKKLFISNLLYHTNNVYEDLDLTYMTKNYSIDINVSRRNNQLSRYKTF
jgi:hypothetical protein